MTQQYRKINQKIASAHTHDVRLAPNARTYLFPSRPRAQCWSLRCKRRVYMRAPMAPMWLTSSALRLSVSPRTCKLHVVIRHETHDPHRYPEHHGPHQKEGPRRKPSTRRNGESLEGNTHTSCPIDVVQLTVRPCVVYSAGISWILVGLVVQPDIQRTLPIELGERSRGGRGRAGTGWDSGSPGRAQASPPTLRASASREPPAIANCASGAARALCSISAR